MNQTNETIKARLRITSKQKQFITSTSWGTIFMAGIGSGKTYILCIKAALGAIDGRRQLIVSYSYPMLRDVVTVTMAQALAILGLRESKDWTFNKSDHTYNVRGTEILLRSGDAPDSLRGLNIHDASIDEARMFSSGAIYDIIVGRLRNAADSRWSIATTPNGKDWVSELMAKEGVTVIRQSTLENPFLPQEYIDRLLETYSGAFARQEIYGEVVEMKGEIIDPSKFKFIAPISVTEGIRYWDLAFADKKSSDWSAGALCLISGPRFTVADMVKVRAKYPDLKELIINNALADGPGVRIGLEDVAAQRAVIDDLARDKRLARFVIAASRPQGTKLARAMPWVSRAALGDIQVVNAHWTQDFLQECASFRADMTHPHDDQIDAVSGAYAALSSVFRVSSQRINFGG